MNNIQHKGILELEEVVDRMNIFYDDKQKEIATSPELCPGLPIFAYIVCYSYNQMFAGSIFFCHGLLVHSPKHYARISNIA